MNRLAVVLLVDRRGWLLLQERDSGAPVAPDKWRLVGGHVEEGESFDEAAYRELAEETGLQLPPGALELWRSEEFAYRDGPVGHYQVYAAAVDHTDADITVGEGRQIIFVAPETIPALDRADSCAHFVPQFLDSELYQRLRGEA